MEMRDDLTAQYVRSILDYDPATGEFRWKRRADQGKRWNSRYAGTVAGCTHPDGHRRLKIGNRNYWAHRLAWLIVHGEWPERDLDHRNGNPTDNRLANLRLATLSQNIANARRRADNTTGFKGVVRQGQRFRAQIKQAGKTLHLGMFDTPEEAHAAYVAAARERFGDFARAA